MKQFIIFAALSCGMVFSNHRSQTQKGFVSVFGDQIVESRSDQLSLLFQYDIPIADNDLLTFDITGDTSLTATIKQADGMLCVSSGTDATLVNVATRDALHYSPGHEGDVFFTALFTGSAANSTQWIGVFDDANGFAIGCKDVAFGLLFRKDSTDTIILQSSFNLDRLDGTGPSGFTIDPTKMNVFNISYGWLGAAPVTYQVMREDGLWIPFHRINYPNSQANPSIINPTLPIKVEITKTAPISSTSLEIKTSSWNASIIGELVGQRIFATGLTTFVTLPGDETFTPLIALHNKTTFRSVTNKTTMQVLYTNATTSQTANISSGYYIKYASEAAFRVAVAGGTFSDINSSLSVAEQIRNTASVTPMSFNTQPEAMEAAFITSLGTREHGAYFLKSNDYPIKLFPDEVLVIAARADVANVTTDLTVSWEEQS